MVLTFLYTHCPVVCPLYFSKIQQAVAHLGSPYGEELALVAITVDPARDTVERLRQYTSNFSPHWLYLTGESGQLRVAWDNYGVYVEKVAKHSKMEESHASHQGYEVIHTAKVALIDKEGFLRSELDGDWQVEELAAKIGRLLSGQELTQDFNPWQSFVSFLYRCGPVSISSLGGAIAHFLFMLSVPALALGFYLLLVR